MELFIEARDWIADCFSDVDASQLTDSQVIAGINRHYEGGWAEFTRAYLFSVKHVTG